MAMSIATCRPVWAVSVVWRYYLCVAIATVPMNSNNITSKPAAKNLITSAWIHCCGLILNQAVITQSHSSNKTVMTLGHLSTLDTPIGCGRSGHEKSRQP